MDNALENFGNLYAVDINADKEKDFLNWNSPVSMESERAKKVFDEMNYLDLYAPSRIAFSDYESELFLKHGIKGIRYLDQRS